MRTGLRHRTAAALILALGLATASQARADGVADAAQGREALLAGKLDEAIRLLTRAAVLGGLTGKNQATTLGLRARAYLAKGQTDAALDDVNDSLLLSETPDARFTRAKIHIAQSRFDDAVADLDRTLEMGSRAADVWALRGQAKLDAGRVEAAVKDLDQAVAISPGYAFAWRIRGQAQMNLGQDDKAITDETRAIALDPKDIEAHWLRAFAWRYRKKDLLKAIADYTEILRLDPADSSARASRADADEDLGRYALAIADYDAWIKQSPGGPFGYWARGRAELVLGRAAAASADLVKAVGADPTDAYAVLWLHMARTKAGTADAAELQANAARADRTVWPGPVLDYLTGKADAAQVLARAGEGKADRLCEAGLFLGQDDLAKGRRGEGLERLQAAANICDRGSREGRLVRASLPGSAPAAKAAPTRPAPAKLPVQQAQAAGDPAALRGSLK